MFASEGPPVSSAGLEKGSGRKQERGHSERSQAPVAVKAAPAGAAGGTEAVLQAGREWNTGETVLLEIPSSSKRVSASATTAGSIKFVATVSHASEAASASASRASTAAFVCVFILIFRFDFRMF